MNKPSSAGLKVPQIVCLTLAFLVAALMENGLAAECGYNQLPVQARDPLEHHFPAWRIVTIGGLSTDDQRLWSKNYPGACPGLIEGDFASATSFAVSLIRRRDGNLWQILILLEPSPRGFTYRILSKASKTAVPHVLLKFPPGRHNDAEGARSVITNSDGIAYMKLESAAILFYKSRNGFNSPVISE